MVLARGDLIMVAPRKCPPELRERAVRMYRTTEPKPQIKRMAVDRGVHPEALRTWIRQAEADAGERDDRPTTAEREELAAGVLSASRTCTGSRGRRDRRPSPWMPQYLP
ncbi:transposase [Streptomyces sp. NPDC002285]